MEIIKHGKTYNTKTCDNCNCEFGYSETDLRMNKFENFKNVDPFTLPYILNCPECGVQFNFKKIYLISGSEDDSLYHFEEVNNKEVEDNE